MTNFFSRAKKSRLLRPLFAAAAGTLLLAGCNTATPPTPINTPASSSSSADAMMQHDASSSADAMMQSDAYKNGIYSSDGTYRSPGGSETVSVSLTLKDDVVTDATFQGSATGGRSAQYQGMFASGFKEYVVGKKIKDLSLTVVNGSSLTSGGFMDAVAKIKAQAKA